MLLLLVLYWEVQLSLHRIADDNRQIDIDSPREQRTCDNMQSQSIFDCDNSAIGDRLSCHRYDD